MTTPNSIADIVEQAVAPRRDNLVVRKKPLRGPGRPAVFYNPRLITDMRNRHQTWGEITEHIRGKLGRAALSQRTVMRLYERYKEAYPELFPEPLERPPVVWWWRGLVTAVLGPQASEDGQDKRCKKCMAFRGKKAFHIALRKPDGTAYLRAICNLCYKKRKLDAAKEAMHSIYHGPDAHQGPPVKVTREQVWEAYGKHQSWRKVAAKLGVTEQTVYRVRGLVIKKVGCWYVRGAGKH